MPIPSANLSILEVVYCVVELLQHMCLGIRYSSMSLLYVFVFVCLNVSTLLCAYEMKYHHVCVKVVVKVGLSYSVLRDTSYYQLTDPSSQKDSLSPPKQAPPKRSSSQKEIWYDDEKSMKTGG